MGKKKAKGESQPQNVQVMNVHPRKLKKADAEVYEKSRRYYTCLYEKIKSHIPVDKNLAEEVRHNLAHSCRNIEQQFIILRQLVCMNKASFDQRRIVTEQLLNCLHRHHAIIYQGLIFGSSVNGMGFKDSDVDLRLRRLDEVQIGILEPVECSRAVVEDTLRNIAYQTTRCSPTCGAFAPSTRCPVAKLKFVTGNPRYPASLQEGLNFDISMLSTNSLGSFNSRYVRFLCHIEPKFHLLAVALKYWAKTQDLIRCGLLSSYALMTMLIFFCQNTSPPLLPTVDQMSRAYFHYEPQQQGSNLKRALIRQELNCLISFKKESYQTSENTDPLCLLLLKFFEFYLNFPYTPITIISTRLGRHMIYNDFKGSSIYDPDFRLKPILNIQDPFDFKHNVTAGMVPDYFRYFMSVIRVTYERLFTEVGKFKQPSDLKKPKNGDVDNSGLSRKIKSQNRQLEEWGLNAIFVKIPKKSI